MDKYNFIKPFDVVNLAYYFFIIILTSFYINILPSSLFLIVSYAFIIIIVISIIIKKQKGHLLSILRFFYPVVFLGFAFESLSLIVPFIQPKNKDDYLIGLDNLIFSKPVTDYFIFLNKPFFNGILSIFYTFYYILPLILLYILYKKHKLLELEYSLFALSIAYYLSYIGYMLLPAIGPRYCVYFSEPIRAGVIYNFIYIFLDKFEHIKQDCFPSGHVAISVLTNLLIFDIDRRVGFFVLPVVIILVVSTVALRYHYGVDVLGGLFLAFLSYFVAKVVYKKRFNV